MMKLARENGLVLYQKRFTARKGRLQRTPYSSKGYCST